MTFKLVNIEEFVFFFMILPPFQIISRFDFFGISVFATHLGIIIYLGA